MRRVECTSLFVAVVMAACSSAAPETLPGDPDPTNTPAVSDSPTERAAPVLDHIAIIVMENREYDEIIGDSDLPFFNQLLADYASANQMYAITHPSLPNYIAMLSGDTQGIESNCTDCFVDAPNLVDQMEAAGISWKAYMEGMPSPCFVGNEGEYVLRHNPFLYFDSIREDPLRCAKVVPFEELAADMDVGSLPRFIWVTPDLCHDTHDCDEVVGDRFLAELVPELIDAMGDRSVVILTYDEGDSDEGCCGIAQGGHIPTVVAGSAARTGFRSDEPYTHYSILELVEESFGLELLGNAACECTRSLVDLVTDS